MIVDNDLKGLISFNTMKQVYFSSLQKESSEQGPDIIHEVFSLACAVYTAIQKDKHVIVVDSERYDLDYLTQSLKKYKVRVLEKAKMNYSLVAVFYGKGQKVLDLTDKVPPVCTSTFNQIQGDPCPNEVKELFMCYRINEIEYTDTYKEIDEGVVVFDAKHAPYSHDYFWLDKANLVLYQDILKHIRVKDSAISEICHVVHVLSKEDIEPYAKMLYKSTDEYYDTLIAKYIEIIGLFIKSKTEPIVIIQKSPHPILEKYLKTVGNPFQCLDIQELSTYTEITQAKGIFVGNFNTDTLTGSACSYYLHSMLPSSQSILIDLGMIYEM
jgi:hypothetical protein